MLPFPAAGSYVCLLSVWNVPLNVKLWLIYMNLNLSGVRWRVVTMLGHTRRPDQGGESVFREDVLILRLLEIPLMSVSVGAGIARGAVVNKAVALSLGSNPSPALLIDGQSAQRAHRSRRDAYFCLEGAFPGRHEGLR